MNPTTLAHLRAVCEKATPGPWKARDGHGLYIAADRLGLCVADMSPDDSVRGWHGRAEDAAFIAAARTALPAALDEIERLRALLREALGLAEEGWEYAGDYFRDKWCGNRLAELRREGGV